MAGSIIDALLVTLGIDTTQYRKGLKQAAEDRKTLDKETQRAERQRERAERKEERERNKRHREFQKQGRETLDNYRKIRNELISMAALFTAGAGFVAFAKQTIVQTAALGRLAEVTGMSTNMLGGYALAFRNVGGTAEEASAQILKASQDVASFHAGMSNSDIVGFLQFGGKTSDLKNTQSYMLGLARLLHHLAQTRGQAYAWMAAQRMGVSYNEFNLLKGGAGTLSSTLGRDSALSGVTAAQARASQQMLEQWNDLTTSLENTGREILIDLAPALEDLGKQLQKLAQWAIDHKGDIQRWARGAVAEIEQFVGEANKAADAVGGWKHVLEILLALKVLSAVGPLLRLAGALLGVGRALGLISAGRAAVGVLGGVAGAPALVGVGLALTPSSTDSGERAAIAARGKSFTGRQQQAFALLTSMGFSRDQALGVMANYTAESGMDPTIWNPDHRHYGLAQWDPKRQGDFTKLFGHTMQASKHPFAEQIAFTAWELRTKYPAVWAKMQAAKGAGANAGIFSTGFEVPATTAAGLAQAAATRAKIASAFSANELFNLPRGGATAGRLPGATTNTTHNTSTTQVGSIIINTQATDAQAIAAAIGPAVRAQNDAWQLNSGMQ